MKCGDNYGGADVPKVGGKHYPYTTKGRAAAKRARAKMKKTMPRPVGKRKR